MIEGIFSHPPYALPQQQQHQYQQSSTTTSNSNNNNTQRVQEIVHAVLAANDAAVALLRQPPPQSSLSLSSSANDPQQNNNNNNNHAEEEALSLLQWAIQNLTMRPERENEYQDSERNSNLIFSNQHEGRSSSNRNITRDGNHHGEWVQENNPDAANCGGQSEAQANAMMIDDNDGLEGGQRLRHSHQALSRASSSSSSTADQQSCSTSFAPGSPPSTPNSTTSTTEAQLLSPQSILALGGTALSIYLTTTVTRHELIVHSVHADAPLDNTSRLNNNGTSSNHPPFLWSTVAKADEMDLQGSPGNLFSIYNRLFIVNDQWRSLNVLAWSQSLPHIPAVLYYNVGLLYHRLACRNGASHYYYRALECYETADLLLQGNALAGVYYLTELDILLLAIRNNMGHIHSHFHNVPQAQDCFHRLLAVFFLSECKSLMTRDEYVFFYINILLFLNRFPLLAGAA